MSLDALLARLEARDPNFLPAAGRSYPNRIKEPFLTGEKLKETLPSGGKNLSICVPAVGCSCSSQQWVGQIATQAVTPVTDALIPDVTLNPLQYLGCTAVTSVTAENEQAALERNLSLWLAHHPPTQADATICPHCGMPNGEIGCDTIATANGIWLHGACHVEWLKQLRQQAIIEMHINQPRH